MFLVQIGQIKRTTQTLENNILNTCAIDFKSNRDLSLIEFAYSNSYNSSIQMVLFEALYHRKCKSPIG